MDQMKLILILLFTFSFNIKQAWSQDSACPLPVLDSILPASFSDAIGSSTFIQVSWSCASGVFQGVWDSTGGMVVDAATCVWSPIECAEKAKTAFKNAYTFFSNVADSFSKVFNAIDSMSLEDKASLLCNLLGSVGTDVLIAILTAGGGSPKVAATIAKLSVKIPKIAALARKFVGIPIKVLGKLPESALEKFKLLMAIGQKENLLGAIAKCVF